MLLRTATLALLLANAAYFAWAGGWLAPLGLAPIDDREPERMGRQIRPEALRVQPSAGTAAAAAGGASAPKAAARVMCLQSGVLDATQTDAVRRALADWPPQSWVLEPGTLPGRWIVYMGKFANTEALEKKRAELRGLRVRAESVRLPALAPGLSLGSHASAEAAGEALAQFGRQGVRTARVVQDRAPAAGSRLRLPAVDAELRARLQNVSAALAGQSLTPC